MGIDFASGGGLFGKQSQDKSQFGLDPSQLTMIQYTFTSVNEETAYTIPAGKTLFVSQVIGYNGDASGHSWQVKFNDLMIWGASIDPKLSDTTKFESPVPLTAGMTIKADTDYNGSIMTIIGWEI